MAGLLGPMVGYTVLTNQMNQQQQQQEQVAPTTSTNTTNNDNQTYLVIGGGVSFCSCVMVCLLVVGMAIKMSSSKKKT